jgi:MYXO-CTERM domain-containing protein
VRLRGLLLAVSLFVVPTLASALTVDPGGPWRVGEGEMVELRLTVSDFVGPVTYAWDLDLDGVFDDGNEDSAEFSAVGINGPSDGFTVGVVVSDDVEDQVVEIPVDVTNTGPQFQNEPEPDAVIGRTWTWTPLVTDLGGDTFELSVDTEDLPLGMTWDALLLTFTWTPNAAHLLQGEPLGHYSFRVTAQDVDNGRTNYDVAITVVENEPPPIPPIAYPVGTPDEVRTAQPTIILNNVDDPDGDPVTYWLQVDSNPCFCSAEIQESGPIQEGDFATEWRLPSPLAVEVGAPESKTYYVNRWTNDGIEDSEQELSLFEVLVTEGGGDADADADADVDGDADGDTGEKRDRGGCTVAPGSTPATLALLALALLGRRRR